MNNEQNLKVGALSSVYAEPLTMYNKSQCSSMLQGWEGVREKERKRNLRPFFQIAIHSIDNKKKDSDLWFV